MVKRGDLRHTGIKSVDTTQAHGAGGSRMNDPEDRVRSTTLTLRSATLTMREGKKIIRATATAGKPIFKARMELLSSPRTRK